MMSNCHVAAGYTTKHALLYTPQLPTNDGTAESHLNGENASAPFFWRPLVCIVYIYSHTRIHTYITHIYILYTVILYNKSITHAHTHTHRCIYIYIYTYTHTHIYIYTHRFINVINLSLSLSFPMLTCMERSRAKSLPAQPPPPGPSAATREIPGFMRM